MEAGQFLWVEKYRPTRIEDCILPEEVKKQFQQFIAKGEVPNLLLSGSAGTGKTTIARALFNEKPLIIFDEATSALDIDNEMDFQLAESLIKNKSE